MFSKLCRIHCKSLCLGRDLPLYDHTVSSIIYVCIKQKLKFQQFLDGVQDFNNIQIIHFKSINHGS